MFDIEDEKRSFGVGGDSAAFVCPGNAHKLSQRRGARWRAYRAVQKQWERAGARGWASLVGDDNRSASGTPVWREECPGSDWQGCADTKQSETEGSDGVGKPFRVAPEEGGPSFEAALWLGNNSIPPDAPSLTECRDTQVTAQGRQRRPIVASESNQPLNRSEKTGVRGLPPLPVPSSRSQRKRMQFARRSMLVSRSWRYREPSKEDIKTGVTDAPMKPTKAARHRTLLQYLLPPPGSGLLRFLPGPQRAESRRAGHRLFQVFRRLRAAESEDDTGTLVTPSALAGDLGFTSNTMWTQGDASKAKHLSVSGNAEPAATKKGPRWTKQPVNQSQRRCAADGRRRYRGLGLLPALTKDEQVCSPCCEHPFLRRAFLDPLRITRLRARRWRRPLLLALRATLASVQMIVEVIILNLPGSAERVRAQRAAQVNALIRSHLAVAFPTLLETEEASASDVEGMTEGETGCSDGDDDELVSEVHNFDITKPNSGCMTTSESEQDDILDWRRRYRIQEYESLAIQIAGSSVREKRIGSYLLRASGGHRYRRQEKETCDSVSAAAEIANVAQIADKSGDIAISPSKRVGQPRISEDLPRALRQHNRSPRNRFARPLDWLRRKAWARSKQQQTTLSKQDAIFALDPLTKTEENMDYFSVLDIGGIRTEVIVIPARRLEEAQKASWPVRLLSSGRKSLSMSSMGSSFSADDPQISAFNDSNSVSDTSPTNQELPLTLVPTEKRSPPDTTMPERTKASDRNPSVAATQVLGGRRRPSEGSSPRITRRVRSQDHGTIRIGNESRVGHEHPRREHATYLELSGPEAYPMTALATKRIRRRQCQVVFLPGNPGCIELYESFLLHCASILASAKHPQYDFIVHGVGLAGHDLRGLNRPGRFYDLADQTRHKLAYIRDHLHSPGDGNDDTLVLVGHSTGAHIICRLLEEDPALAERAQVILLTPAIADVADGIRTAFRQRAFIFQRGARQLTAGLASTILRIAPERMIDDLVDEFLAHRATPAVARRIRDLFRLAADKYHLFINILALAADKCLHIGDMNISLLRRFAARLVMYYVPNDPFAPSEQCARVRTEVPEAHVEFEQERVYHGFILNEHQTLRVASKVAHWVLEAVCQSPAESGFGDG